MYVSVRVCIYTPMSICVYVCVCKYIRIYTYRDTKIWRRCCWKWMCSASRPPTIAAIRVFIMPPSPTYMTHSHVWHDPFIYVTWPILMCDMTHSYVQHDPFSLATWPILMRDMTHSYIHMCDMTHSHVWPDSFICVTWLIDRRDITWGIHACDMSHSCVSHVWFPAAIRVVIMPPSPRYMTHSYV